MKYRVPIGRLKQIIFEHPSVQNLSMEIGWQLFIDFWYTHPRPQNHLDLLKYTVNEISVVGT